MENRSTGAPRNGGRPSSAPAQHSGAGTPSGASAAREVSAAEVRKTRVIRAAKPVGGTRPAVPAKAGAGASGPKQRSGAGHEGAAGKQRPGTHDSRPYFARIGTFAWVMIGVGFVCVSSLVSSYVSVVRADQRMEELNAQNAAATAELNSLTAELNRWNDPNFVKTQARARLQYVMPGEIPFRILDQNGNVISDASHAVEQINEATVPEPWYDTMWGTVKDADAAPRAISLVPEENK